MQMVIYGPTGTGRSLANGFPYLMAGKSGTAERFSRTSDAYNTNKSNAYLASRHRAWFVAYAPANEPEIAVVAMLESGAWGAQDAGPIVRKILDAWLASHGGVIPGGAPAPVAVLPPPSPVVPEDTSSPDDSGDNLPAAAATVGGNP